MSDPQVPIWFSIREANTCLAILATLQKLRGRYSLEFGSPDPITMTGGLPVGQRRFNRKRERLSLILEGKVDEDDKTPKFYSKTETAEQICRHLRKDRELINRRLPVLLKRQKLTQAISLFPLPIPSDTDWDTSVVPETLALREFADTLASLVGKQVFARGELPPGWITRNGWPRTPIRNARELADRLEECLSFWREPWSGERAYRQVMQAQAERGGFFRDQVVSAGAALAHWNINCLPVGTAEALTALPESCAYSDGSHNDKAARRITDATANVVFWIRDYLVDDDIRRYLAGAKLEPETMKEQKLRAAKSFICEHQPITAPSIAKHIHVSESAFRSRYLPILRTRGVSNDGTGYVCDDT